ncbi:MAG: hypothetical protein LBK27_06480 [Treponema sp.]|jgi:hypothetical protein|nr:hypothetical protein [Treponema sp.]
MTAGVLEQRILAHSDAYYNGQSVISDAGPTAIYPAEAIEAIRNVPGKGRPRKKQLDNPGFWRDICIDGWVGRIWLPPGAGFLRFPAGMASGPYHHFYARYICMGIVSHDFQ